MGALSSRVVQAVTLGLLLATATPPMARGASTVDPMVETWTPSPPVSIPLDGADGSWQRLDIPVPMYGQAAIYDPVRERMLVYHGTVLALSLGASPKWNPVVTAGTAPGLSVPSAIYDPRRDRMLLVGGNPGAPGSDVWALSLTGVATWAQLLPAGVPPSGRNASAAVYDSVRDRILVFGGYDGTAAATCDFDRDVPLLRDQTMADATAIEDAMRKGVRDAFLARGEPITEDVAAVAALQALSAEALLVPLALARAGGVSELELFLSKRSARRA